MFVFCGAVCPILPTQPATHDNFTQTLLYTNLHYSPSYFGSSSGGQQTASRKQAGRAARAASKQQVVAGNKQQAAQRKQQASKQQHQANSKQAAQRKQAALGSVGGTEASVATAKVVISPKKTVGAVTQTARVQAMPAAVKSKAGGGG